jgi:hypothetical protein
MSNLEIAVAYDSAAEADSLMASEVLGLQEIGVENANSGVIAPGSCSSCVGSLCH